MTFNVSCPKLDKNIYEFSGNLSFESQNSNAKHLNTKINIDNFLLKGSILKNSTEIEALILYTSP